MPPLYLTPKSSNIISPDAMASCPSPPHRAGATISCEVIVGAMTVPELKLGGDANPGFFLISPNDRSGDGSDEAPSFVPIERAQSIVPIIKLSPRPSRAFVVAAAATTHAAHVNVGIAAPSSDDNEEEEAAPPSSPSATRAKTTTAAAVTPTTMKTPSIKNSYELAVRDSKRQKMGSSPFNTNAATVAARATTRRPSFSSRAA